MWQADKVMTNCVDIRDYGSLAGKIFLRNIIPEGIRGDDNLPEGDGRTERGEKNI